MNRLDVTKIIQQLKLDPTVLGLFGTRMFWGLPKTTQTGLYLSIQEITENQDLVDAVSRVQFRIWSADDNAPWVDLFTAERAITSAVVWQDKDFNGFKAYKVTLESNLFTGYDEAGKKIYIRDYLFHYFS